MLFILILLATIDHLENEFEIKKKHVISPRERPRKNE